MKENNYLKMPMPELLTGSIKSRGMSEEYKLLHVSEAMDRSCLKADVLVGASQFAPLMDINASDIEKYVVVKADSEEEGLIAISYLHNILTDAKDGDSLELNGFSDDSLESWLSSNVDDYDEGYDDEIDIEDGNFLEGTLSDPRNITVLDYEEALSRIIFRGDQFSGSPISNMEAFAPAINIQRDPFWFNMHDRSVCIVKHMEDYDVLYTDRDSRIFDFFSDSEYVYYLIVCGDSNMNYYYYDEDDNNPFDMGTNYRREDDINNDNDDESDVSLTKMLIRYTADVIDVRGKQGTHSAYLKLVFNSIMHSNRLKLADEKEFNSIMNILVNISNDRPAYNIDRTLKYLLHKDKNSEEISVAKLAEYGIVDVSKDNGDIKESMDDLVGMEEVKKEIENIVKLMRFHRERRLNGVKHSEFHNVFQFIGAPGTAKTTVAKAFGRLMKKNNLLKRTRFKAVTGAELKGEYVGHTAPKIKKLFESYDIILIDEAYSIAANDHGTLDTFSQEALAQLAIELEEHSKDKLIIFAGYGGEGVTDKNNKMKEFLDANPGIRSRINETIRFESYTPEQMVQIVHHFIRMMELKMVHTADQEIEAYFSRLIRNPNFGNGRDARRFADQLIKHLAVRTMDEYEKKGKHASMDTVTKQDIIKTIKYIESNGAIDSNRRYGL
ncbi:MAG: AAA family ATPase [Lachnospiraceae bacterium]|nr:AAA family ATPase [Lachnospiraceae bacterium]